MADVTRLQKLVRKANGLQDFQRAGLNASGTGLIRRPVVLIDNSAGNAMPIKLSGHEQARRTCADHQYLAVSSHQIFSCSCFETVALSVWICETLAGDNLACSAASRKGKRFTSRASTGRFRCRCYLRGPLRKSSIVSTGTIEMAAFSLANIGSLILVTRRGVGHFTGPLNIFEHEAADHLP